MILGFCFFPKRRREMGWIIRVLHEEERGDGSSPVKSLKAVGRVLFLGSHMTSDLFLLSSPGSRIIGLALLSLQNSSFF